jgi:hypothetical protein
MNKYLKILLALLLLGGIGGIITYKFVMRETKDLSNEPAEANISFVNYISMADKNDTAALNKLTDKIITVNGSIKEVMNDDSTTTVILGDTISNHTITCQIDRRYLTDFKTKLPFETIKIKGKCTGFLGDDLGIGSTLQLKNCVK